MPGKDEGEKFNEIAKNEIWRECIRREDQVYKKRRNSYACNLKMLRKDQITSKPGSKVERFRDLTMEEDLLASKILRSYGLQTGNEEESLDEVRVPGTTASQIGLLAGLAFPDHTREQNLLFGCNETNFAKHFYEMTRKSPFSRKED